MASTATALSEEARKMAKANVISYIKEGNNPKAMELAAKIGDVELYKEAGQNIISQSLKDHDFEHAIHVAEVMGEKDQARSLRHQEIDYVNSSFLRRRNPEFAGQLNQDNIAK